MARIWSAVLVQTKGWARSFHPLTKARILVLRSLTEPKVPRWMAWRSIWIAPGFLPHPCELEGCEIMPKKIDPKVKERCVRQVLEHRAEYSSLTAAAAVVARREGLGKETVRRWVVQAQIDSGQRQGATSEELAEIKDLKAKVRRLEEDNEILRRASIFFAGELDPRDR